MPQFPKREAEIIALADAMIAGYLANPGLFPHADVAALQAKRAAFQVSKDDQTEKQGMAQLATEEKDHRLDDMAGNMTTQIRQSEVDTKADPEVLKLINWGPKSPAHPSNPPGQPQNLDPVVQGPGNLYLDWKAPVGGTGGAVRTYLIERREQPEGGGAFNAWHQVTIALTTESTLIEQPRNVQLEYRIVAVNAGGSSMPSNVAAVVL